MFYVFPCENRPQETIKVVWNERINPPVRARNHQGFTRVYLPTFVNINDLIALSSMGKFLFECLHESDRRLLERKYGKWAFFLDKSVLGVSNNFKWLLGVVGKTAV